MIRLIIRASIPRQVAGRYHILQKRLANQFSERAIALRSLRPISGHDECLSFGSPTALNPRPKVPLDLGSGAAPVEVASALGRR